MFHLRPSSNCSCQQRCREAWTLPGDPHVMIQLCTFLWRSPAWRRTYTYFISIRMFIQWWFLFLFQFQTAFIFISIYGFHFRLWFSFRFLHAISFCIFLHLFSFLVPAFISSSLSISTLDFHFSCLFLYRVLIFMKKCKEKMWKYLFWSTDHRPVLQNNYVHKISPPQCFDSLKLKLWHLKLQALYANFDYEWRSSL